MRLEHKKEGGRDKEDQLTFPSSYPSYETYSDYKEADTPR